MTNSEIITQVLINYVPMLIALGTFIFTILKVLKAFKDVLSKSTLETVKDDIEQFITDTATDRDELTAQLTQLIQDNKRIKQQNAELLTQLTRIEHKKEE